MAWRVPVILAVWIHPHLYLTFVFVVRFNLELSWKEIYFSVVVRIDADVMTESRWSGRGKGLSFGISFPQLFLRGKEIRVE